MKILACIACLLGIGTGCATEHSEQQSDRFAGRWFIEETQAHALYGASTYELTPDGAVGLLWDAGLDEMPQGHVRHPDSATVCVFADGWRSFDDESLVVDVDCSDEVARALVLSFTSAPAANAVDADVTIASVGGESGWLPPEWGWSFRKCEAAEPCVGDEL